MDIAIGQEILNAIRRGSEGLQNIQNIVRTFDVSTQIESLHSWRDDHGYSFATWAVLVGNVEALSEILSVGVNQGVPYPLGKTQDDNILWFAIKHTKTLPSALMTVLECMRNGCIETKDVFELVDANKNVLHLAAQFGALQIFKEHCGVDPERFNHALNAGDTVGQTPLHVASYAGNLDIVKEVVALSPALLEAEDRNREIPLHGAVRNSHPNKRLIVKYMVGQNPDLITRCDIQGCSPYIHAARMCQQSSASHDGMMKLRKTPSFDSQIVDDLKEQIFRRPNLSYGNMRKLIHHHSIGAELFLDLSLFDDRLPAFGAWLEDLDGLKVAFDSSLKIVKLPELHCTLENPCDPLAFGLRTGDTAPAPRIFNFLASEGHGQPVRNVTEVDVRDCPIHPHTNSSIQGCLATRNVKILNWRKKDFDLNIVKKVAPAVEELTLYSSGNMDVLNSSTSDGGLKQLANGEVEAAELAKIQRDTIAALKLMTASEHCRRKFESNMIQVSIQQPPGEVIAPDEQWSESYTTQGSETIFNKLKPLLKVLRGFKSARRLDCCYAVEKPIKIAVVDTGVSSHGFTDIRGRSFVENSAFHPSQSLWHTVQNAHGTKVAWLAKEMNPFYFIYAARTRTGPGSSGVDIEAVKEALAWATSEDIQADIICMSWSLEETPENELLRDDLLEAVNKAASKSILFAATGDRFEGAKVSFFPACWDNVISICSTDINGNPSKSAEHSASNFWLAGEGLPVKLPRYLVSNEKGEPASIHGSSGATALAAGLASLILTCVRFAFYPEDKAENMLEKDAEFRAKRLVEAKFKAYKTTQTMRKVFKNMCSPAGPYFVQPWEKFEGINDEISISCAKDDLRRKLEELRH